MRKVSKMLNPTPKKNLPRWSTWMFGRAFVLDIETFTGEDFLQMIASPLGLKDASSLVRMVHKNKKVENFRRLTEYVKGGTSLDDCTFYLQPKLKGGAKRPIGNDTRDVKMARLMRV